MCNGVTERTLRYRSEFAEVRWAARLAACQSVADLKTVLADWPSLTDAHAVVDEMADDEFPRWERFRRASLPSSKTPPAVSEWQRGYGAVLIPDRFIRAVTVADNYKVPFGTAWKRLAEFGWPEAPHAPEDNDA